MQEAESCIRRSMLIMPADREDFVAKAWNRGADAVCLDLEDSVAPARKAAAREHLPRACSLAARGGGDVLVRVNNVPHFLAEDLAVAVMPGVNGLIIPKIETPRQVRDIEQLVRALEEKQGLLPGGLDLTFILETARGFVNRIATLKAVKRRGGLILGTEDFTLDLGMHRADPQLLAYPKLETVILARAFGLQPLGLLGSIADFKDTDALFLLARTSYESGYRGATCIHPNQVTVYNRAFSPDPDAVEAANRVVQTYREAVADGKGSAALDGKMIDAPVAERAQRVLDRAEAVVRVEQRKKDALARHGVAFASDALSGRGIGEKSYV